MGSGEGESGEGGGRKDLRDQKKERRVEKGR